MQSPQFYEQYRSSFLPLRADFASIYPAARHKKSLRQPKFPLNFQTLNVVKIQCLLCSRCSILKKETARMKWIDALLGGGYDSL
ncbi:hypothetical protein CWC28_17475 [Pseudoalteromonas sp. S4492]|nr:hypothetical protein CWC28_17475 [Pseudoalteromonas sp. S4492]